MRDVTRRTTIKGIAAFGTALGSGLIGTPAVLAQAAYPTKPIEFIVPLAPGGAIDFIARALGERMSRSARPQRAGRKPHRRRRHASAWTRR